MSASKFDLYNYKPTRKNTPLFKCYPDAIKKQNEMLEQMKKDRDVVFFCSHCGKRNIRSDPYHERWKRSQRSK